jgi:hypothetical protein
MITLKMTSKLLRRAIASTVVSIACAGLIACGGGSSGNSGATPTGTVNVAVTDGPGDDYSHVWVTVKAIAFHTSPNANWVPGDSTWQTYTLPAPVTVDLASLNNGTLDSSLFSNLNLPAGTYHQIRFFMAGADASLSSSAAATTSTNGSLQWNDQVEYQASGVTKESPLEIPYPNQGIQLNGTFTVSAASTLNIAVDFDLDHSVVPFRHNGLTFFVMKPVLRYFDLSKSGAIVGKLDSASLCAGTITSTCAYHLIVKAELLSPNGTRHMDVHATIVRPDGSFVIYPVLATDPTTGNALTYDVLIRGRQMDTMLVTGVPVTAGTNPLNNPTSLQTSGTIPLSINSSEYTAQLAAPLSPLTSGYALFQQTLPGTGNVPYEIRFGVTDPFTGLLLAPMPLANSGIRLASYNSGNALSFASVTPQEGTGNYSVSVNEALVAYYTRGTDTLLSAPGSGNSTTFTPNLPTLNSGVVNGTVTGHLFINNSAGYDHGQLVIAHLGVVATSYDISSQLGNASIPFSISDLPAGSTANPQAAAYYFAYLRLWKSGDTSPTEAVIVPYLGVINLTTTNTAQFNIISP